MEEKDLFENGIVDDGSVSVSITLDDDTVLECIVLNIFSAGDREYIAVMPETDDEEGTVYLYRYSETADEYEIVADAFDELLDDEEFEDMLGEDEL